MNIKDEPHLQFHRRQHTQFLQNIFKVSIRPVEMVASVLGLDKLFSYMCAAITIRECAKIKCRRKRFCVTSMSSFNYFHVKTCKLQQALENK